MLFPTLISCCYQHATFRDIVADQMNCALLATFINSKIADPKHDPGLATHRMRVTHPPQSLRRGSGWSTGCRALTGRPPPRFSPANRTACMALGGRHEIAGDEGDGAGAAARHAR